MSHLMLCRCLSVQMLLELWPLPWGACSNHHLGKSLFQIFLIFLISKLIPTPNTTVGTSVQVILSSLGPKCLLIYFFFSFCASDQDAEALCVFITVRLALLLLWEHRRTEWSLLPGEKTGSTHHLLCKDTQSSCCWLQEGLQNVYEVDQQSLSPG